MCGTCRPEKKVAWQNVGYGDMAPEHARNGRYSKPPSNGDGHQPNSRGFIPIIRISYWRWDDHPQIHQNARIIAASFANLSGCHCCQAQLEERGRKIEEMGCAALGMWLSGCDVKRILLNANFCTKNERYWWDYIYMIVWNPLLSVFFGSGLIM